MKETILRLSQAILGFRREDVYEAVRAREPHEKALVDAALDDLVEQGLLRAEGGRFYASGRPS